MSRPDVSIIVPTYNRSMLLQRLLGALEDEHARCPCFEVVVAVDGSSDGTLDALRTLQPGFPLEVWWQENRGPAAARNRAIAAARGDLLLFLDDDVVPTPGLVTRHLQAHRDDPRLVVSGPMLPPPGARLRPWLAWEAAMLRKQYDAMIAGVFAPTPRQFYTGNASVRREHVVAAGGFDERFRRAEDVELAYRMRALGLRFAFDPAAVVRHEPDRSLKGWRHVGYEYGRYDVLMSAAGTGRPPLQIAADEWGGRHLLARGLTRACVGHPARMRALRSALPLLLRVSERIGADRASRVACSAVFNVEYWQGVADATGTGSSVWRLPAFARSQPTDTEEPAPLVASAMGGTGVRK